MDRLLSTVITVTVLVCSTVTGGTATDTAQGKAIADNKAKPTLHRVSLEDARFVAAVSTFTQETFVSVTVTSWYTCNVGVNAAAACRKRKLRRFVHWIPSADSLTKNVELDSSLFPSNPPSFSEDEDESNSSSKRRNPKLAFIVWNSSTSTVTITTTSINSATTFSISYFCSIQGASYPPVCA